MAKNPTLAARIRGSMVGLAVCDALGGPVEFKPRGSFLKVTELLPNRNFGLPEGCFTDDTSMALCLANSLLENDGKSSATDQVTKYLAWLETGYMSSTGACFDIGVSTRAVLAKWSAHFDQEGHRDVPPGSEMAQDIESSGLESVTAAFDKEKFCGNGSLMRVVPAALIARNEQEAASLARQSSAPTHPHSRCVDACDLYCRAAWGALNAQSKEIIAQEFSKNISGSDVEVALRDRLSVYETLSVWNAKPTASIRSTGYVVDSLEAALWAFFTTHTFEQGAIAAVNLGDDADTIGAIYGGLAGAYYGVEQIPARWLNRMRRMDLVNDAVEKILALKGLQ